MKKIVVLIIALFVSLSLSAASNRIGVSVAPEWTWYSGNGGKADFLFMAEGANQFGGKHSLGIEYGLGVSFPFGDWSGNSKASAYGFVFKAGPSYRYEISSTMGFSLSAGVNGVVQAHDSDTIRVFTLDAYGSVSVDFAFMEFLCLDVGVMAGGTVFSDASAIGDSGNSADGDAFSRVFFAPFAVFSYRY